MVMITIAPLLKAECMSRSQGHVGGHPMCLWGYTSSPNMPNIMAELHDAIIAANKHASGNVTHKLRYSIHLAYLIEGQSVTEAKRVLLWRSPVLHGQTSGTTVEQFLIDHLVDAGVVDAHEGQLLREEASMWRLTQDRAWRAGPSA